MSSTLMWRPALPQESGDLSYELKRTLSRRFWDTDGSCGHGEAVVGIGDRSYIEGLRDAGVKGADKLLDILDKHGEIIIWHQH